LGRRLQQPQQKLVAALFGVGLSVAHGGDHSMAQQQRPPNPSDTDVSPRYRSRAKTGRRATLDALNRLSTSEMSSVEHFTDFFREIADLGNQRGAAILLATHLEDALQLAVTTRLKINPKYLNEVLGFDRPLGSFTNKIRMAYAIGLITQFTRTNLDIIRSVRNAFAHSVIPISFDTTEVLNASQLLELPQSLPPTSSLAEPYSSIEGPESLRTYRQVCVTTSHNLLVAAGVYFRLNRIPPPESV
jgi:hypothetical protein